MPEFAKYQQNAKKMFHDLTRHFMSQQGCLSFFSNIVPNNSALDDAYTIGMLASSLDDVNDKKLQCFMEMKCKYFAMSSEEFEDFKTQVILGIYLFKWSHYHSSVAYYINKPLIALFQADLGIKSPTDLDNQLIDGSLKALSQYCSYIYENREKQIFDELNNRLGATIQVEIHNVSSSKFAEDSSWYGVYAGIIHTLGMN